MAAMTPPVSRRVFATGVTGYVGRELVNRLAERGHRVYGLVRPASIRKAPTACEVVAGDPFNHASFVSRVHGADTFVQLVGVAHPTPWKGEQFRRIDLKSVQESVAAAEQAKIAHFIYVSVAHPAPAMRAYIDVRVEGESLVRSTFPAATILRPWYILGPGHHWPRLLLPLYWLMERLPSTREGARRLGLLHLQDMVDALVWAVEHPAEGIRVLGVPDMKALALQKSG